MIYQFIIFCLIFTAYVEGVWLECKPSKKFEPLTNYSYTSLNSFNEKLVPYLQKRGVFNCNSFVEDDLFNISQALSILFEEDSTVIFHRIFLDKIKLIDGFNPSIDHVGRELYGQISFYISILEELAPKMGLLKLNHLIFPSIQVVKILQQNDPQLKGVIIGRVYFQDIKNGKIGCIELFQSSDINEEFPQNIEFTKERLFLLTCGNAQTEVTPIDHISIELDSIKAIQKIHEKISLLASETLRPYQKEVSHNPADGSTQTKVLMRDSIESPFNKIVEFVHYKKL